MLTLQNDQVRVGIDAQGNLVELANSVSGHNYAGSKPLWRLYFQRGDALDREILASEASPEVSEEGEAIVLRYNTVRFEGRPLDVAVTIRITLDGDDVRWVIEVANHQPGIVIRECQFPLVGNLGLKATQSLIWSKWGGQRFRDVRGEIEKQHTLWHAPDHLFVATSISYPRTAATNCYLFADEAEGLYIGCHNTDLAYTQHELRLYGEELEAGLVRYPGIATGETWQMSGYVLSPYTGTWHVAAHKYRAWADTWFRPADPPDWVRTLNGWQRVILKHQYGEIHYRYDQLPEIYAHGMDAGIDTLLLFGWWKGGMDNDYPNYVCDEAMGGEAALIRGIQDFQTAGGTVMLYGSGRLIDVATDYYRRTGRKISIKDRLGIERREAYRFRGSGTYTGNFADRTFVVACPSQEAWFEVLKQIADLAFKYGCRSVFYDQMGAGEYPCCDETHGHAVPFMQNILAKADALQKLRAYVKARDPDMALGTELLCDVTAQHADYIHGQWGACVATDDWEKRGEKPQTVGFTDWFRYAFPEIILSDREIRDDSDIERRVNHALLKGLRSDVEIYRCRRTIAETPHYSRYMKEANRIRKKYADLLLTGTYRDTLGFTITHPEIDARCFEAGDRKAVLLTQSYLPSAHATLAVGGYHYTEHDGIGRCSVEPAGEQIHIELARHALAIVVLERTSRVQTMQS